MKYFYSHSLPSSDSRRAVVSFWRNNVHKYWLTARTKPVQEKMWLGKLTMLDMTLRGGLGNKTSTQTQKFIYLKLSTLGKIFSK